MWRITRARLLDWIGNILLALGCISYVVLLGWFHGWDGLLVELRKWVNPLEASHPANLVAFVVALAPGIGVKVLAWKLRERR